MIVKTSSILFGGCFFSVIAVPAALLAMALLFVLFCGLFMRKNDVVTLSC